MLSNADKTSTGREDAAVEVAYRAFIKRRPTERYGDGLAHLASRSGDVNDADCSTCLSLRFNDEETSPNFSRDPALSASTLLRPFSLRFALLAAALRPRLGERERAKAAAGRHVGSTLAAIRSRSRTGFGRVSVQRAGIDVRDYRDERSRGYGSGAFGCLRVRQVEPASPL